MNTLCKSVALLVSLLFLFLTNVEAQPETEYQTIRGGLLIWDKDGAHGATSCPTCWEYIQKFMDWKMQKGIHVHYSDAITLDAAINGWQPDNMERKFILIVGDGDGNLNTYVTESIDGNEGWEYDYVVPPDGNESTPADGVWADYPTVDGRPDHELFGRMSVKQSDTNTLIAQLARSIWYERDLDATTGGFAGNALLIQNNYGPGWLSWRELQEYQQNDNIAGNYTDWENWLRDGGYSAFTDLHETIDPENPDHWELEISPDDLSNLGLVFAAVEEYKSGYPTENGHWEAGSSTDGWFQILTRSQVQTLNFVENAPFIMSGGNHFGNFCDQYQRIVDSGVDLVCGNDEPGCIAEEFMWHYGNNDPTSWFYGAIGVFMNSGRMSTINGEDGLDGLARAIAQHNKGATLGGLCASAMKDMVYAASMDNEYDTPDWCDNLTYTDAAIKVSHNWILFGDPSLQLRTKTPSNVSVATESEMPMIPTDAVSFQVTVTNPITHDGIHRALCAISYDDPNLIGDVILLGSAETNSNGVATIGLDWTDLPVGVDAGDYLKLTITGFNLVTNVQELYICDDVLGEISPITVTAADQCTETEVITDWDIAEYATYGYLVEMNPPGTGDNEMTRIPDRNNPHYSFTPESGETGTYSWRIAPINQCNYIDGMGIEGRLPWSDWNSHTVYDVPSAQAAIPALNESIWLTIWDDGNYYFPPRDFRNFQWDHIIGAQRPGEYELYIVHGDIVIHPDEGSIPVVQNGETTRSFFVQSDPVLPTNIGNYIGQWNWYVEFSNDCGSFSLPEEEQWRFYVCVDAVPVSIQPAAESSCCYGADITFEWEYEDNIVPIYNYLEFDLNTDGDPEIGERTDDLNVQTYTRSFATDPDNRIQWRIVSKTDLHCPEYYSDWIPLNLIEPDRAINLTPNPGDWICSSVSNPQGVFFIFEASNPLANPNEERQHHTIHWRDPHGNEDESAVTLWQEPGQPDRYVAGLIFDDLETMQGNWAWWVETVRTDLCCLDQIVRTEEQTFHVYFLVEPPELFEPENNRTFCVDDVVTFSWTTHPNAEYYTFYIHGPENFDISFPVDVPTNPVDVLTTRFGPCGIGDWTWEVEAVKSHEECPSSAMSETFAFNVVELPGTAQLRDPSDGASVFVGFPQVYSWRIPADADNFQVEWATSDRFDSETLVSQIITASGSISEILDAEPQRIYWRVISMRDGCYGSPSEVRSVHLELPPLPTNVTLTNPPSNSTIYDDVPVRWEWSGGDFSAAYRIQWSNDGQFVGCVEEVIDGTEHSIFWPFHGVGSYYWRVRGENASGNGPWSKIWKGACASPDIPGTVILDTPREGETVFENDPATEFCVLTEPMAADYIFEWDMNGSFKNPIHSVQINATQLCVTMPLSPCGIWYWRAQAINSSGAGHWSDSRRLIVELAPLLLQVVPNRTERMSSKQLVSELSWPAAPGADRYTVQIASNRDFSTDVIQWNTELTRTAIDLGGSSAQYWRVKARFGQTCGDWSSVRSFEEAALQDDHFKTFEASEKGTSGNGDAQADGASTEGLDAPQSATVIPNVFTLYQNSPNPFNPNTEIRFDLSEDIQIELKVFNTLGQLVTILADEVRPAGTYSITWNGTNQYGAPVSSGLYFYQLTAGSFVSSRKMILLR